MFICTCEKCNGVFKAEEVGPKMPGCKDKELITCPYCKANCGEHMANGWFQSFKLSKEEQDKHRKSK